MYVCIYIYIYIYIHMYNNIAQIAQAGLLAYPDPPACSSPCRNRRNSISIIITISLLLLLLLLLFVLLLLLHMRDTLRRLIKLQCRPLPANKRRNEHTYLLYYSTLYDITLTSIIVYFITLRRLLNPRPSGTALSLPHPAAISLVLLVSIIKHITISNNKYYYCYDYYY